MVALGMSVGMQAYSTQQFIQIFREADHQQIENGSLSTGSDGQVSQNELADYTQYLTQQQSWLSTVGGFFQRFMGHNPFQQSLNELSNKLHIAQIINNHYEQLAGGVHIPVLSEASIQQAAWRDGNGTDISVHDLGQTLPSHGIDLNNNTQILQAIYQEIPVNGPYSGLMRQMIHRLTQTEGIELAPFLQELHHVASLNGMPHHQISKFIRLTDIYEVNRLQSFLLGLQQQSIRAGNFELQLALQQRVTYVENERQHRIQEFNEIFGEHHAYVPNPYGEWLTQQLALLNLGLLQQPNVEPPAEADSNIISDIVIEEAQQLPESEEESVVGETTDVPDQTLPIEDDEGRGRSRLVRREPVRNIKNPATNELRLTNEKFSTATREPIERQPRVRRRRIITRTETPVNSSPVKSAKNNSTRQNLSRLRERTKQTD